MKTCARCKGKFPEPGIEKNGKLYCCDKCAKGPKQMMFKVIPAVLGVFGLGFLTGSLSQGENLK
jgi:hypothetical protein